MTWNTFQKCQELIWSWRTKTGKPAHEWPDSRDPEFQTQMLEAEVVSQDLEKALVVLAAWRESREGVYQGISCLVHLLRNRQNAGMFRSHLSDVDQFPHMAEPDNDYLEC